MDHEFRKSPSNTIPKQNRYGTSKWWAVWSRNRPRSNPWTEEEEEEEEEEDDDDDDDGGGGGGDDDDDDDDDK